MRKTRVLGAAVAVLIAAGTLVAWVDGASTGDKTRPTSIPVAAQTSEEAGVGSGGSDSFVASDAVEVTAAFGAGTAASAAPAPPTANRVVAAEPRVIKSATVQLSVSTDARVTKATAEANRIASAHGGFIAGSDASKGEQRQTILTVRVPAASFDAALTAFRRLGKVANETLSGRDVTSTLVDLDARLRSLRAQESALNALLAKANTVGETLQVAQAAGEVRTQIEQLAAQQATLSDQADFATIALHILGPNVAIDPEPKPEPLVVKSFERAVGGTLAVFGGTIVVLGYVIPAALLAALGYGVWRLLNSRRPAIASE